MDTGSTSELSGVPALSVISSSGKHSISAISRSSTIKEQLEQFSVVLHKRDTLSKSICNINVSKRTVIGLTITVTLLLIGEYTLNNTYILSFFYTATTAILCLCAVLSYIAICNINIIRPALKSFVLWYKCIHVLISGIARYIYYNFWIYNYRDNSVINYNDLPSSIRDENNTTYISLRYWHGLLVCLLLFGVMFVVSCVDGIATKGNNVKRIGFGSQIALLIWYWIQLYFDLGSDFVENKNKAFVVNVFNKNHYYYWRSIALSGIFKSLMLSTQMIMTGYQSHMFVVFLCFVFCFFGFLFFCFFVLQVRDCSVTSKYQTPNKN